MKNAAHGSFAFDVKPDYTLVSASGAWNLECVLIHNRILEKRAKDLAGQKRASIVDGRFWEFETPDCEGEYRRWHQHMRDNEVTLYIAYWASEKNALMARHILSRRYQGFDRTIVWNVCETLDQSVSWLRSEGFDIPQILESDFPVPIPASDYPEQD